MFLSSGKKFVWRILKYSVIVKKICRRRKNILFPSTIISGGIEKHFNAVNIFFIEREKQFNGKNNHFFTKNNLKNVIFGKIYAFMA